MSITLADAVELARRESYLAVVSTIRADGTVQSSLVNAGVIDHAVDGRPTVAYVTYGPVKLANLRHSPTTAVTFRSGWSWCTIEGTAQLVGPDDPHVEVDAEQLRLLLRNIFIAAGGSHDNWAEYDRVMASERRTAVLVSPTRIYGNLPTQ